MILDAAPMKELFLSVIKRAKEKYRFRIENFCIMGNHFHFVLQPAKGENLSAIMRWIMSVFAMAYNRFHGLSGHVWGSRFFSRIISGLKELMRIHGYIDNNPAKTTQSADSISWRYTGIGHIRERCTEILDEGREWLPVRFPATL